MDYSVGAISVSRTYQLHDLELPIIGPQEGVQAAVLHVLGDDHDGGRLGHHALHIERQAAVGFSVLVLLW